MYGLVFKTKKKALLPNRGRVFDPDLFVIFISIFKKPKINYLLLLYNLSDFVC